MEAASLSYLTRREHSQFELRHKLALKGFPARLIEEVIRDLSDRGLQSDSRFAEAFSRSRLAKGQGTYRIRQELRQRGIAGDAMPDLALTDWDEQIDRAHARKFGDAGPASIAECALRERYLLRKGFSGDQIRRLFRRLPTGDGDV